MTFRCRRCGQTVEPTSNNTSLFTFWRQPTLDHVVVQCGKCNTRTYRWPISRAQAEQMIAENYVFQEAEWASHRVAAEYIWFCFSEWGDGRDLTLDDEQRIERFTQDLSDDEALHRLLGGGEDAPQ